MMDGWSEYFDMAKWMAAFEAASVDPAFYANREREKEELFPWDLVDIGVDQGLPLAGERKGAGGGSDAETAGISAWAAG